MAVVSWKRTSEGTSISAKYGESAQISEKWHIRVDTPTTPVVEIVGCVSGSGVGWGSPHPEFPDLKAMEFTCAPVGKDGMIWNLEVKYYIPPIGKKVKENGVPEDVWEMTGSIATVPVFQTIYNQTITNAAKDPLEGLEREMQASGYTLTKFYVDDSWRDAFFACAGKVNNGAWANGAAKTWKCDFKSATPRSISRFDGDDDGGQLKFVETKWEFRYEPKTWKCMPWDVGFMELVNGERKTILGADKKPVKQPVALNNDGTKKAAGQPPTVINNGEGAEIYETADFGATFGTPELPTS